MEKKVQKPILIAHRGASGYYPEHSMSGYQAAIEMGCDYIEPDLVISKDGHLMASHNVNLSVATNIENIKEFASRKRYDAYFEKQDWFVNDFTLSELKKLRLRQAFPGRSKEFDDSFEMPTYEEVLRLRELFNSEEKVIGIYPETKHPTYFKSFGLDFERPLLELNKQFGLDHFESPIFIQSFEDEILKSLSGKTKVKLIMLLEEGFDLDLEKISKFAYGLGPDKALLLNADGEDSGFVAKAHNLGLKVHPWTFRSDQLEKFFKSPKEEYQAFLKLGIDGLFSDFSDTARKAIDVYS